MFSEKKLNFADVAIHPRLSDVDSRADVNLNVEYKLKYSPHKFSGIPVCVANMDSVGCITMARALHKHKMWVALNKFVPHNDIFEFFSTEESAHTFVSIGENDDISFLQHFKPHAICIDVANAYRTKFHRFCSFIRELCPDSIIMAGNVCTPEGVKELSKYGVDIVKCGIASGGFCETKNKTGIYYPQFSCAKECSEMADYMGILCCSDGGCKEEGDFVKALGAGAHLVMSGGMFAGYDENEGEWEYSNITYNVESPFLYEYSYDKNYKSRMKFYGMSSKVANEKHFGGLKDYRASEGREDWVEYKGKVDEICTSIKGGLSSACTYLGIRKLQEIQQKCQFHIVQ